MDVLDKCQTVIVQLPAKSVVYDWLYIVHDFYRPVHTYVSIMLCAVGAVCNFCNIVVLTRYRKNKNLCQFFNFISILGNKCALPST